MTPTQRAIHAREAHQLLGRCMALAQAIASETRSHGGPNISVAGSSATEAADALSRTYRALQAAEVVDG